MAKSVVKEQMPVLDATDLAILKLLQQNARITIKEISEQVHLSTTPVHERIRRMEQNGVIKQYITVLNAAKVGKGLMVICYVSLRHHSKNAFHVNKLSQVENVGNVQSVFVMGVIKQTYNLVY